MLPGFYLGLVSTVQYSLDTCRLYTTHTSLQWEETSDTRTVTGMEAGMRTHASLPALLTDVLGCAVTRVTSAAAAAPSLGLASSTDSLVVETEAGAELRLFLKIRRAGSQAETWDTTFGLYRQRHTTLTSILGSNRGDNCSHI